MGHIFEGGRMEPGLLNLERLYGSIKPCLKSKNLSATVFELMMNGPIFFNSGEVGQVILSF